MSRVEWRMVRNRDEDMKNKFTVLALSAMLYALCLSAEAQQPAKIPRIGYVSGTGDASNQGPYVEALRQGLRDLGYIEGKNITIEYRGAEGKGDRIPSLVHELVQLQVDVLIVPTGPAILTAKQATKTGDPITIAGRQLSVGSRKRERKTMSRSVP